MATLFIVTAPSGAGKTSLVEALIAATPDVTRSVSHTTRAPRPGEQDGVDYHFTGRERFLSLIDSGDFLEHAEVFGNLYGTSRSTVEQALAAGRDVILVIDWQGAATIKKLLPDACSIFIVPPSLAALRERLSGRGQDDAAVIEARLAEARDDIGHHQGFDYLVVNDVFDDAAADLRHIVLARRLTGAQQIRRHETLLAELLGH